MKRVAPSDGRSNCCRQAVSCAESGAKWRQIQLLSTGSQLCREWRQVTVDPTAVDRQSAMQRVAPSDDISNTRLLPFFLCRAITSVTCTHNRSNVQTIMQYIGIEPAVTVPHRSKFYLRSFTLMFITPAFLPPHACTHSCLFMLFPTQSPRSPSSDNVGYASEAPGDAIPHQNILKVLRY